MKNFNHETHEPHKNRAGRDDVLPALLGFAGETPDLPICPVQEQKMKLGFSLQTLMCALLILVFSNFTAFAIGQRQYVTSTPEPGAFPIVQKGRAATIAIDPGDWPGVVRAARDLKTDIARVTGIEAPIVENGAPGKFAIIVGTVGKSRLIDNLVKSGKIATNSIAGKWESFFVQLVTDPLPGVSSALVLAGSDKRGTIYAIYDVSEQIGVSPWYWWADVPVRHKDELFAKPVRYMQGEPSVKYRGIFLNDESPDLSGWVREKFGTVPVSENPPVPSDVANYNSKFYSKLFELILRLKGNYLWPAMWNNAFNEDDPENPRLADEYGIVMGTSHQEPMLRAQKEWDRRYKKTLGSWNYYKTPDVLQNFWREGIRRNKSYESIITIGLRGADDTPMIPGGTVAQSMALLEQIVGVQRKMISEEINPDVAKVPQLWCLYKEVQEYYKEGLRVPDDVTLLWADDNWGNIRRLPTEAERKRAGGAGIYYHFDYVGGPRNYKWINTNPLPKIWEQMSLAKAYGADRIWIVNVGHFKGLEIPIEYFMHLGWNTKQWTNRNINEYTRLWAEREFGPTHAQDIAGIVSAYAKFNGRRKPELLEPNTYSLTNYGEADRTVAEYRNIVQKAESIFKLLPENTRDAFYQLVLFPAKACAQVNELYVAAARNALYAKQGRASANDYADQVEALFKADADLMDEFNHKLGGGKWNHFMDQVHIGYTIWQDPPRNIMPKVTRLQAPESGSLGVAVEGSTSAWPGGPGAPALRLDRFGASNRYIDIFNRGKLPFEFTANSDSSWIIAKPKNRTVSEDARVLVSIDWSKAPKGLATGFVEIAQTGSESIKVKVESFNPGVIKSPGAFIEGDGYISIEAENYTKNVSSGEVRWEKIDDYGKTVSAMSILPVTAPGAVPPKSSPCLEYRIYLHNPGEVKVLSTVAPSLNFVPGRGLKYATSFDDQPPQIVEILPEGFDARNGNREWEESVRNNSRTVRSSHKLTAGGLHTLKIWMVDPGVVLQRIVVDTGGLQPSYLGPPESTRFSK